MSTLCDAYGNRLKTDDWLKGDCCSSPGPIAKVGKINPRHKEVTVVYLGRDEEIDFTFDEFGHRGFVKY